VNRLWVKLSLAFLAISLAAIGVVAVLASRATGEQFRQYVVASGMAGQTVWAQTLTEYYATQGSWVGVDAVLAQLGPGGMGMGRGRAAAGSAGPNIAVADTAGRVLASRTGELVGETLPASVLAQGVPLTLDGRSIGTLLNVRPADVALDAQGQAFLHQVQRSLVWAALLAAVLSLGLGVLVSRVLTTPLARLTRAAQAIADGDLSQRVQVADGNGGEIGDLGAAFNGMAASLAQAETLRKNLVADVSHELRTPLTIIQGNIQAILDGVYPLEMAQMAGLYDETRLLMRLVDDLHDLALAEAGQLRLERAPVDLVALVRTTVGQFEPVAGAARVSLTLEAAENVPDVLGDADRLAQVLRNLLSNALRHTPAGGQVIVHVGRAGEQAEIRVADTGSGVASEDLPHVFDRFYRGDKGGSRRGGGAGLGLAITRQLVVAHGGQIAVVSQTGTGATFTVTLPALSPSAK
jgi:two-component system OmpR family sensor kinase/two-component system sensor histidine kinase BaeS